MDLATATAELYAMDPDGFIARRTEIVKQLRADKQREPAKQVAALRRPTRGAWLVNLLARSRADELAELLDLGPALAEAHTAGSADQLRTLTTLRRRAVSSLVDTALALGREAGYRPSDAVRDEVSTTLEAALNHPEFGQAVRAGSLHQAAESAASFPTELFAGLAPTQLRVLPPPPADEPDATGAGDAGTDEPGADEPGAAEPDHDEVAEGLRRAEREAREQALATAREQAEQTRAAAADADVQLATSRERVLEVEARVAELRAALAQAESDLEAARTLADRAQQESTALAERTTAHELAVQQAAAHLAELADPERNP